MSHGVSMPGRLHCCRCGMCATNRHGAAVWPGNSARKSKRCTSPSFPAHVIERDGYHCVLLLVVAHGFLVNMLWLICCEPKVLSREPSAVVSGLPLSSYCCTPAAVVSAPLSPSGWRCRPGECFLTLPALVGLVLELLTAVAGGPVLEL